MIRVILADDNHVIRQGIKLYLDKTGDIEVVAEAEDGREAIDLTKRLLPDVLIMDINMPCLNGIEAARQLQSLKLATQVVILSLHSDENLICQALRTGVRGYLPKISIATELPLAIRAAHQGNLYLSPTIPEPIPAVSPASGRF